MEAPVAATAWAVTSSALRLLAREGPLPIRVVGNCMAPTLRDGEIVTVKPVRRYFPGDVIACRQPGSGRLLMHRVLGYRRTASRWAYLVRGDACVAHDGLIFPDHIIGRANSVVGTGKTVAATIPDRALALGRWLHLGLRWLARRMT